MIYEYRLGTVQVGDTTIDSPTRQKPIAMNESVVENKTGQSIRSITLDYAPFDYPDCKDRIEHLVGDIRDPEAMAAAISGSGFSHEQVMAQIDGLLTFPDAGGDGVQADEPVEVTA